VVKLPEGDFFRLWVGILYSNRYSEWSWF
jgi:hypothetical protein